MADPVKDDGKLARSARERDRSAEARKPGGNPDKKPSANAGNVGLGAADDGEAPRKPGSAR
jgi:hypothetical protein